MCLYILLVVEYPNILRGYRIQKFLYSLLSCIYSKVFRIIVSRLFMSVFVCHSTLRLVIGHTYMMSIKRQ